MPGPEAFANPFEAAQRNGVGPNRNPSAIGSGRGRAGSSNAHHVDGHSPTAQSTSASSWTENHAIRMRKLPESATKDTVRSMLLFATDYLGAEFISSSREDRPYLTAIARFLSSEGAIQAVQALNGKQAGENAPDMLVELVTLSPGGSVSVRRFPDGSPPENGTHRRGSRYTETFRDMDHVPTSQSGNGPLNGALMNGVSPTFRSVHAGNNGSFSGQSQIGQPLERQHISGRSMIQEDGADDETDLIMQDPGSFMSAERQMQLMQQGRRATAPNISLAGRMGGLSLNSNVGSSVSPLNMSSGVTSPRGQSGYQSPDGAPFSPPGMNGMSMYGNNFSNATSPTSSQWQPFQRSFSTLPPVNPADQNPPCNTLYVGNLPMDTSEDELKNLFCKVRGYRRLCFRMKSNGPMCFVEFEDIGHATRALKEYYGTLLSNSVRGGIRLSFSKNPLGVRGPATQSPISPSNGHGNGSGSMSFGGPLSGYTNMNNQSFSTASGPPPGLPAPQGFAQGSQRNGSISGPVNGSTNGSHTPSHQNHSSQGSVFQPPGFGDAGRYAQYTR